MALSSLGTFKKNTTTKFSIKSVFKNFDEALCLLLFHQRLRLNPLHQGGLVHPADVNKSHSAKKNRTNLTPLNYSCDWSIIKEKRKQKTPPKNLQLFRQDPEDLWGQEDQVDPVKHSFVSQIQHLWRLILHFVVKFLRMAGKKKNPICTGKIHTNTQACMTQIKQTKQMVP